MSKMSKIVEYGLKRTHNEAFDDEKKADEYMEKRSLVEDESYEIPKRIYHTHVEKKILFGCQMILFNESESTDNVVIYLHGGAYVNEITPVHISFCDKLAKKTNATVFAPLYPLAPNHSYEETYDIIEKLYNHVLDMKKPITIMGDSAGGGLSVAFSEYLAVNEEKQPNCLILISPWVDVSMSGDYGEYIDRDPMVKLEGLREMGLKWAGTLNPKDYKVSPLYGDTSKLPKTKIFVGTHELIYLDILRFYDKLKADDVDVELIVGEEMTHVYPIYPLVPESKEAFDRIVDIITKE